MTNPSVIKVPAINKKVLFTLWGLCVIGFFAVIPYTKTLSGIPMTLTELLDPRRILSILTNILFLGLLVFAGLYIARRIGLGLPILTGLFNQEDVREKVKAMLPPSVLIGVIGSTLVILLDVLVFSPPLEAELKLLGLNLPESINPPAWQGLLASIYGSVNEEVLLRLFALSLIGGLVARVFKKMDQKLPAVIFWIANLLAAVLFGLGHLPATAGIGLPLDFLVVSRAIVLNGLLGVGLGWLYWKYGLESAMLGHFTADIVLHVLTPLVAVILA